MTEDDKRHEEAVAKITAERDELQREIVERMDMMKQREETITGKDLDPASEIIEELKLTLIERENSYNQKLH